MGTDNGQPGDAAGFGPVPTVGAIREHVKDLAMQRTMMARYPKRFAKLDKAALDKITAAWITAVDDAEQVEDPARRGALKDSVMRTAVMAEKVHQADEHLVDGLSKSAVQVNVQQNITLVVPPPKVIGAQPNP